MKAAKVINVFGLLIRKPLFFLFTATLRFLATQALKANSEWDPSYNRVGKLLKFAFDFAAKFIHDHTTRVLIRSTIAISMIAPLWQYSFTVAVHGFLRNLRRLCLTLHRKTIAKNCCKSWFINRTSPLPGFPGQEPWTAKPSINVVSCQWTAFCPRSEHVDR